MKKEFTANILFLIGINLLIKPFYALAIDTSVQNIVGPQEYGLFLALFNFVYIQQIFSDLGIQNFNNRNISRNPKDLINVLPKTLSSKILFTLLFIVITIGISLIFDYLQYFNEILVWIILSQASLSFLLYLRTNISGTGKYFTDSFISVLDKLILIIWMSYLIWVNPNYEIITISYFAKVQFASVFLTLLFVLVFTHRRLGKLSIQFDLKFTKALLKKSWPYASLVLLMAGYSRIDSIMLEQMINDNALAAGKYARSFRLYDTFNNFTFLFAVLLLPMFSRMIKRKEKVNDLVTWANNLLALGSIYAIITIFFRGEEILDIFYVNVTAEFPLTLFLLITAGFALSLNYVYGTLLTANGDISLLNKIALAGFGLNIIANLYLIPMYLGPGAAFATLITQFLVLIFQLFYCFKYFDLGFNMVKTSKLLLVSLVCFGTFYVITNIWYLHLVISILVSGVLTVIAAFAISFITVKDIIPSFHTFAE